MKYIINQGLKSAVVVTPSIDNPLLKQCIDSVQFQKTKYNFDHLIVYDGVKPKVKRGLNPKNLYELELPWNTGGNGFYGHRIYAAVSHLLYHDVVFFLDEDNFYEPDHIETCMDLLNESPYDFVHSYRNVVDLDGNFLCKDRFEAIGKPPILLVDTSAYCFKRDFLMKNGHYWHHGWGADRRFFNACALKYSYQTTEKFTVNYRLDGNPNSPAKEFFFEGNKQHGWNEDGSIKS